MLARPKLFTLPFRKGRRLRLGEFLENGWVLGELVMHLIINGELREAAGIPTVGEFLASCELPSRMVVVERNGDIVPRDAYDVTPLANGDVLEIVQMMAGG